VTWLAEGNQQSDRRFPQAVEFTFHRTRLLFLDKIAIRNEVFAFNLKHFDRLIE